MATDIDSPARSSHEKKNMRLYMRELGGAIVLYAVLLVISLTVGTRMADSALRTALFITPMIGFGAAIWAIARSLRRMDEFERQSTLETLALTAALTMGITFTYGFLENAGYPRLSMFVVWPLMAAIWGVINCVKAVVSR